MKDARTWRGRVVRQDAHWKAILPALVNAYIRWRYPPSASESSPPCPPTTVPPSMHTDEEPAPNAPTEAGCAPTASTSSASPTLSGLSASATPSTTTCAQHPPTPPQHPPFTAAATPSSALPETDSFEITVIDLFDLSRTKTFSLGTAQTVSEALVANGYLGSSPIKPSLAISLRTLELFRCVRLFKSSFSIEAFAKLICHYYLVSPAS